MPGSSLTRRLRGGWLAAAALLACGCGREGVSSDAPPGADLMLAGLAAFDDRSDWAPVLARASARAVAEDRWLNCAGAGWIGVSEFRLPANLRLRDCKFRDVGEPAAKRRTLWALGDGSGEITLENVRIDRNGGESPSGFNRALWIENFAAARLENVEVFGDGAGEMIRIQSTARVRLDVIARDGFYVHTDQTDDAIEGVVLVDDEDVSGNAVVRRLGRTDRTSPERDRFSRGLVMVGVQRADISVTISQVDQCIDISGNEPTFGALSGAVSHCATVCVKGANAQRGLSFNSLVCTQPGLAGVILGGAKPDETDMSTWTQDNQVVGMMIRNVGTNQLWSETSPSLSSRPSGVMATRESAIAPANEFPKGVTVHANTIVSDLGSATFAVPTEEQRRSLKPRLIESMSAPASDRAESSDAILLEENGLAIETGVRVRLSSTGALPAGLEPDTDYFLIAVRSSRTAKLARSYIDALDSKPVGLSSPGTGTHTLTLQSDMAYGVNFTDIAGDPARPNLATGNTVRGALIADTLNAGAPSGR